MPIYSHCFAIPEYLLILSISHWDKINARKLIQNQKHTSSQKVLNEKLTTIFVWCYFQYFHSPIFHWTLFYYLWGRSTITVFVCKLSKSACHNLAQAKCLDMRFTAGHVQWQNVTCYKHWMNSMGQATSAEGNEQTRFQVVPNYSEWSLWFVEKGGMIFFCPLRRNENIYKSTDCCCVNPKNVGVLTWNIICWVWRCVLIGNFVLAV